MTSINLASEKVAIIIAEAVQDMLKEMQVNIALNGNSQPNIGGCGCGGSSDLPEPATITGNSRNNVIGNQHTHAINKANIDVEGIVKITNDLEDMSANAVLSTQTLKAILAKIKNSIPNVSVNNGVSTLYFNSETAYPKGSLVILDGNAGIAISIVDNNKVNPNKDTSSWELLSDNTIVAWSDKKLSEELKKTVTSCTNIKELQDIAVVDGRCAILQSGNTYFYEENNLQTANGSSVIASNKGIGKWIQKGSKELDPRLLGAVADGVTDDTFAIKAWLSTNPTSLPSGSYAVTSRDLVKALAKLKGTGVFVFNGVEFPSGDIIDKHILLPVPSAFWNIQDALDWLAYKRIIGDGSARIKVDDGVYEQDWTNLSRVIDGSKLAIVGNEEDPSKCVINLNNRNNHDGFLFEQGYNCSWLNGFTINGTYGWISAGKWNKEIYGGGVRAIGNVKVTVGSAMVINKMYYGIRAMEGATIHANGSPKGENIKGGGIKVTNAGDVAFHAYAATLECNAAEAYDTAHTDGEDLGFGFCAEAGGMLICEYAVSQGNAKGGFYSLSNGTTWAHGVKAQWNKYGVLAWGGVVECNSLGAFKTELLSNSFSGIYSTFNGFVGGNGAIVKDNQQGIYADNNALIDATGVYAGFSKGNNVVAENGGIIRGGGVQSVQSGDVGFLASNGSRLILTDPKSTKDKTAFLAKNMSFISAINAGATDQTTFANPTQDTDKPANNGSYIVTKA